MKKAKLTIQKSSIHGYGVFTRQPIKKGKFIAEMMGSRVVYKSVIPGQSNRYNDWIGVAKDTWIDPIDEFQYLNHSCNPSSGLRGTRKLKLYAMRDLSEGEEITINYATTEDDPDYCFENLEPEAEGVVRFVGPIQSLPPAVFTKYLPLIPDYFRKVYEREVLYKNEVGKINN